MFIVHKRLHNKLQEKNVKVCNNSFKCNLRIAHYLQGGSLQNPKLQEEMSPSFLYKTFLLNSQKYTDYSMIVKF